MRAPLLALALALVLLVPSAKGDDIQDDPGRASRILEFLETPQLEPGGSGEFRFNFTNPYPRPMENTTFTAEIYLYATIDGSQAVDQNWTLPFPRFANGTEARRLVMALGSVPNGTSTPSTIRVETSVDMPHGSVFSQATYFVRFRLEFDYDGGSGVRPYTLASRGYFPRDLWERATNGTCTSGRCSGFIDLGLLGVDGVLPDSLFGVKEPIPIWPFWLLLGLMGFFLVLSFLFWVEANPAAFPRVERGWATARGKLRQFVAFYGPRRRRVR